MVDLLYKCVFRIYPSLVVVLTRALLEDGYSTLLPLLSSDDLMVARLNRITSTFPSMIQIRHVEGA